MAPPPLSEPVIVGDYLQQRSPLRKNAVDAHGHTATAKRSLVAYLADMAVFMIVPEYLNVLGILYLLLPSTPQAGR